MYFILFINQIPFILGLEDIKLDEIVSIRVRGNPIPFAVGVSLVSWEGILHNGMRGRAVRVLHIYGDTLCQKWNKNTRINEGFSLIRIRPLPGYEEISFPDACLESESDNSEEEEDNLESNSNDDNIKLCDNDNNDRRISLDLDALNEEENTKDVGARGDDNVLTLNDLTITPNHEQTMTHINVSHDTTVDNILITPLPTETEMDSVLEMCLMRALYYIVKDKHMPYLVSALWSLLLR